MERYTGYITYGGLPISEYNWNKVVTVCEQLDYHNTNITVDETIEFSKLCQFGLSDTYDNISDQLKFEIDNRTKIILSLVGLTRCANTIVGDSMKRGVSGGERRRVTLCECLTGLHRVLLLDKFSTGLDSAVTIDIVRTLKDWASEMDGIVLTALLQPDIEVIKLYDNVVLLEHGEIIFQGPPNKILSYFSYLNYFPTPDKDLGSFASEISTVDFRRTLKPHKVDTLDYLVPYYERSIYCNKIEHPAPISLTSFEKKIYTQRTQLNLFKEFTILLSRQFKLLLRDKVYFYGRMVQCLLLGIIMGLVFGNLDDTTQLPRIGLLMFSNLIIMVGNLSQIGSISNQARVLNKHKRSGYFSSVLYVISTVVAQYPMVLIETLFLGIPLYFITKLNETDNYIGLFYFLLENFLFGCSALVMVRSLVFFFNNEFLALCSLPLALFLVINTSGFTTVVGNIFILIRWIYYINPMTYGLKILVTNEFISSKYGEMGPVHISYMDFPQTKDDFGLWFLAIILIHIFFFIVNILVVVFKRPPNEVNISLNTEDKELLSWKVPSFDGVNIPQITLSFEDLSYCIKIKGGKKILLDHISGSVLPSSFMALMGASGAGKTTLLDVLAGRKKSGHVMGLIKLNGQELDQSQIDHYLGYVEQGDTLPSKETVLDALRYSANLRLPRNVSRETKNRIVDQTINLLELRPYANVMIGTPGNGISLAIRKLIMTGIELVANPSIIFLDEPTTGLDSKGALLVIQFLKKIALSGRTVMCTIHQPSFETFNLFTHLLILERGGRLIYLGESGHRGQKMVDYFEKIPGMPLCNLSNPASWVLEITGAGISKGDNNFGYYYVSTDLYVKNSDDLAATLNATYTPFQKCNKFTSSFISQVKECSFKMFRFYWRASEFTLSRFLCTILISFFIGLIYLRLDRNSVANVQATISAIFISSLFVGLLSCIASIPAILNERPVIYREVDRHIVHPISYCIAFTICEIPYSILITLIVTVICYPLINFNSIPESVGFFIGLLFALILLVSFFGQLISFIAPNLQVAILVGASIIAMMNLLSGFIVPKNQLYLFFKIIYYIDPIQYLFTGIASTQLRCNTDNCPVFPWPNGMSGNINEYARQKVDVNYDLRWYSVLAAVGFLLLTRVLLGLLIWKKRHQSV